MTDQWLSGALQPQGDRHTESAPQRWRSGRPKTDPTGRRKWEKQNFEEAQDMLDLPKGTGQSRTEPLSKGAERSGHRGQHHRPAGQQHGPGRPPVACADSQEGPAGRPQLGQQADGHVAPRGRCAAAIWPRDGTPSSEHSPKSPCTPRGPAWHSPASQRQGLATTCAGANSCSDPMAFILAHACAPASRRTGAASWEIRKDTQKQLEILPQMQPSLRR